jgi:hypothetical protein
MKHYEIKKKEKEENESEEYNIERYINKSDERAKSLTNFAIQKINNTISQENERRYNELLDAYGISHEIIVKAWTSIQNNDDIMGMSKRKILKNEIEDIIKKKINDALSKEFHSYSSQQQIAILALIMLYMFIIYLTEKDKKNNNKKDEKIK